PAASASDLEALKNEIKKAREEAADEAQRQAREIVRLRADLERERQERALQGADSAATSAETKKAVERSQVVRAGRFGLSLTGFIQADGVLYRQSFLERSNAERALFPGEYDLGVRLSGGWRFLRYAVAAMNGDPIGEKAFPGRDPNESKDLVGRLGVDLRMGSLVGLAGGFSALWGT